MDIDAQRAQRLFQAIVTQSLIDATSNPVKSKGYLNLKPQSNERLEEFWKRRRKARRTASQAHSQQMTDCEEARRWLLRDMEAFPQIVTLAGYNPVDIRERAKKLSERDWVKPADIPAHARAA